MKIKASPQNILVFAFIGLVGLGPARRVLPYIKCPRIPIGSKQHHQDVTAAIHRRTFPITHIEHYHPFHKTRSGTVLGTLEPLNPCIYEL